MTFNCFGGSEKYLEGTNIFILKKKSNSSKKTAFLVWMVREKYDVNRKIFQLVSLMVLKY